jgi:hypothetical protein
LELKEYSLSKEVHNANGPTWLSKILKNSNPVKPPRTIPNKLKEKLLIRFSDVVSRSLHCFVKESN